MKYTKKQLERAVRLEKMELHQERIILTRRLREIEERWNELTRTEYPIEGLDK